MRRLLGKERILGYSIGPTAGAQPLWLPLRLIGTGTRPSLPLMRQQHVRATPGSPPIWEVEHLATPTPEEGGDTGGLKVMNSAITCGTLKRNLAHD
jgi:hypothetical protein